MLVDRSKRPVGSAEIDFKSPKIQNFVLSNGLKIFFSEKNDLPILRLNLIVNGGSRFDDIDRKGLSNLLSMCIDEGAGKYNALELADEFEMIGANYGVSCDNDIIIISVQVLIENFSRALNLIGDIVKDPHLNEGDFSREKHKVLTKIHQAKTEPDYVADVSFGYLLFGKGSPYAYPSVGTEFSIPNLKNEFVKNYYKKTFAPSNSSMVIVGNLKKENLLSELQSVFGDWTSSEFTHVQKIEPKKSQRKTYLISKKNAPQTEIRIGLVTAKRNESDFFHKQIINLILGGQFSSRLNINLREKNGYTYGVHSRFNYFKEAGFFGISTSVDVQNTANALKEIYTEIDKIQDGITENELRFAQSSFTKKYPLNFETYRQIAANISAMLIHDLPDNYFETYTKKISSVNLFDVNKSANSSFQNEQLVTVLVGDSEKILNLMKYSDFGDVDVIDFIDLFKS